jgi:ADP-heptose:LPS heptosyltransferase
MIIISPYSKRLINGKVNPKNYPFWKEFLSLLPSDFKVVQVGIEGEDQLVPDFRKNLSLNSLKDLIRECDTWVSCDSFFQHLAWSEGKKGVVLWSVSDPIIYGHPENVNLLKSRDFLSENQFLWWELVDYDPNKFVHPHAVLNAVKSVISVEKSNEMILNA